MTEVTLRKKGKYREIRLACKEEKEASKEKEERT